MKSKPKVTIVTLNYNGAGLLDKHYTSLISQSYVNFEMILVDNGSTDNSVIFMKKNFPRVRIIKIKDNVGPVKGYMVGAQAVGKDSDYMIICGNDTWFDKDWLKELVKLVVTDPKIALCGARQMNYKGDTKTNTHGMSADIFGYAAGVESCFYINGVALMVKRDVFFEAGGFDERFWVYVEEVDLAWRIRLLGYKVGKAYNAITYHLGGATLENKTVDSVASTRNKTSVFKRYLVERNTLCMILKNYSFLTLCCILPAFFILNTIEGLALTVLGKPSVFVTYVKAWWWNVKKFPETLRLRQYIQKRRKISDIEVMKLMYRGWAKLTYIKLIGNMIITK